MDPDGRRIVPSPAPVALAALVLASLAGAVPGGAEEGSSDGADPPATLDFVLPDLAASWAQQGGSADAVLGGALEVFNALVREKGVPTVLVP